MKKRKNKFSRKYVTATEIGRKYGLSARALGKILIEIGIKDGDSLRPTPEAIENDFCTIVTNKEKQEFFMWNRYKISDLLKEKGYEPSSTAGNNLSEDDEFFLLKSKIQE